MLRLLGVNRKAICLTRYRLIKDRLAVSERYKAKLQLDLKYITAKKLELELLILNNDKDINHWRYWDRQKDELRAVMEKIPKPKNNK